MIRVKAGERMERKRHKMFVKVVNRDGHVLTVNDGIGEIDLPVRHVRIVEEHVGPGGLGWCVIEVPGWLARKKELV